MTDFQNEIRLRAEEARQSLAEARADGDDYLAGIRLGEMETLVRIAADHEIRLVEVEESLAANGLPTPAAGFTAVRPTAAHGVAEGVGE